MCVRPRAALPPHDLVHVHQPFRLFLQQVASQNAKRHGRFGLRRGVLVGDRGMLTEARQREEVRPMEGQDWILVPCSRRRGSAGAWLKSTTPTIPGSGKSSPATVSDL
ncbi:MAG TPA: hypothetical protein PK360_11835 [bacterium]|nr:hypothetical protein [bacterium]